ncbi:TetR family transcriptional regulator [uncultured Enterococcus sp.]|uniref:TetR family transcriptional regulator n=1 Tax=uncultured Enterococcus sp. TaxID=167972 RepID=UPI0025D39DD4|nr:TetR family transcriptional regulator [uncultured Enterococcus sp.]
MPTDTFLHLPKEKQQRIMEAARIEFSRVSLKEASVANIVKVAEIPRGSFYQYFADKEDLYFYYFHSLRQSSKRELLGSIKAKNGDLFLGIEHYFTKLVPEIFVGEHALFYKNLFMNMDYREFRKVAPELEKHRKKRTQHTEKVKTDLEQVVDPSNLTIASSEELIVLFQLLMQITMSTISEAQMQQLEDPDYNYESVYERFHLKLKWVKQGVQRKEREHA